MRIAWLVVVVLCACNEHGKGGGSGTDAAGGTVCGGFTNSQCAANELCDFARNDCGRADGTGICRPRPQTCPDVVAIPTCGCDGKVYGGPCDAAMAGVDVSANGGCPVPADKFACGFTQCDLATQYCQRTGHPDAADDFSCVQQPTACGVIATCGCLAGEQCGSMCTGDATSGLTVSCN